MLLAAGSEWHSRGRTFSAEGTGAAKENTWLGAGGVPLSWEPNAPLGATRGCIQSEHQTLTMCRPGKLHLLVGKSFSAATKYMENKKETARLLCGQNI